MWVSALTALALGCDEPAGAGDAGPESADLGVSPDAGPPLPPCDAEGTLLADPVEGSDDRGRHPIAEGDALQLVLGFQGFLFLEVAVRAPEGLPASVDVSTSVAVDEGVTERGERPAIRTHVGEAGAHETERVLVFFNDTPAADVYGRAAEVVLGLDVETCRLLARARVQIVP